MKGFPLFLNLPSRCRRCPSGLFLALAAALLVVAGCSKSSGDAQPADAKSADAKPADAGEASPAAKPGVTLDAETQERLGLKIDSPVAAQWLPGIHATGRVANPLAFIAATADYETARVAATSSQAELDRTQKLVSQENATPRALEAAQAAAARDALALQSARAKFTADWGPQLAARTNLAALADELQAGDRSLLRLFLPVGVFPKPLPASAIIYPFGGDTNAIAAELVDDLNVDPNSQVQALLFSVGRKLSPDLSVSARLRTSGEAVSGLVVPVGAVLRYEGRGWVYVQTATNQFVRAEVSLDRLLENGWVVSENLSATNRIVVTGAQSVLSADMSGAGFTTGERD
jgi:hypothetical protein